MIVRKHYYQACFKASKTKKNSNVIEPLHDVTDEAKRVGIHGIVLLTEAVFTGCVHVRNDNLKHSKDDDKTCRLQLLLEQAYLNLAMELPSPRSKPYVNNTEHLWFYLLDHLEGGESVVVKRDLEVCAFRMQNNTLVCVIMETSELISLFKIRKSVELQVRNNNEVIDECEFLNEESIRREKIKCLAEIVIPLGGGREPKTSGRN